MGGGWNHAVRTLHTLVVEQGAGMVSIDGKTFERGLFEDVSPSHLREVGLSWREFGSRVRSYLWEVRVVLDGHTGGRMIWASADGGRAIVGIGRIMP